MHRASMQARKCEHTPGFNSVCAKKFAPLLTSFRLKFHPQTPPWGYKANWKAKCKDKVGRQGTAEGRSEKGCREEKLTCGLYLVPVTMSHPVCCWCLQNWPHRNSAARQVPSIRDAGCHIDSGHKSLPHNPHMFS